MNRPLYPSLSVELYWSLPGPRRFMAELVQSIETSSAVVVRIDQSHITGVNLALRQALEAATQQSERSELIDLDDGVHLESAIGHHFDRATLSALELAGWTSPPRVVIGVTPKSERARQRCREYLEQFIAERKTGTDGTVRLVIVWNSGDDALVPPAGATVSFNGALSSDEMHAYVALRMVGQHAPGSTSLTRHLVTEFAGSDPMLAEALIALPSAELLRLPESLANVALLLPIGAPKETPEPGAVDAAYSSGLDWALSRTSGTAADAATKRLHRRYWRACVRSLLPWLEERRFHVVSRLRPTLEDYLYPHDAWRKQNPWDGKTKDIAIDDLEFNDIVAMTFHRNDPLQAQEPQVQKLLTACLSAKRVRDALAHMRPPSAVDIESAVRAIEEVM